MIKETFQQVMLTYLHRPYIWGGDDPIRGLDCSGLVQELLSILGLDPKGDQTAQMIMDHFAVTSRHEEGPPKCGSLYFFGSQLSKITHVAMGFDSFTYLEAGGGGSRTLNVDHAIAQNALIRLRPNTSRVDLLAVINPKGLPW